MKSFLIATILAVAAVGFAGAGTARAHSPWEGYAGYGNGAHDFQPHEHTVTPWGGVRSYSITPLGPTKSFNGLPYYGGYSAYYGGYTPLLRGYYGGWGW
jgi:hypothetical protein